MDVLPPQFDVPARDDSGGSIQTARRGNRRRLAVFAAVFVASLLIGQAWNFSRTDEYRASSRLQITVPDAGGAGSAAANAYGSHLQLLNSRPLLEKVARQMADSGHALPGTPEEAVSRLQTMLNVQPVTGTDVVQLLATGEAPAQLAGLLNAIPEVVRSELLARQAGAADAKLSGAQQELLKFEKASAERRARLEQFRGKAGLLAEREENDAVARSRGLSNSLNMAIEKEAAAEARLRTLAEGAAAGRTGTQARDDRALVALEGRASQAREDLRAMERSYTPEFMAMDPRAIAARTRLIELERQIAEQRIASHRASLHAAEEDLASARALVERLRSQQAAARPALQSVSARFAQAKLLEDDLAQIERARRDTLARVARMQADEGRRVPSVAVLEAATVPTVPFRPDRTSDSLWILAGSLLLAVCAMGLVEFFNRPPVAVPQPANTTLVLSAGWGAQGAALPAAARTDPALPAPHEAASPRALPAPPQALQQAEAAALLAAAPGSARFICAAALMGLTTQEVAALRRRDIDTTRRQLSVPGAWARCLTMPEWLESTLPPDAEADEPLLHDASGTPLTDADLQALVACASVDAGLPQGASLTLDVLRNTCIEWLLGQGLRFSQLPALVGRLDADRVAAFAARSGDGARQEVDEIAFLMPALCLTPPATPRPAA